LKVALLADIHGNIYALKKVIDEIIKKSPDFCIFVGDLCGYYYYTENCIEELNRIPNLISVRGNHDQMFLDLYNDNNLLDELISKFGKAYEILLSSISEESLNYLNSMPNSWQNEYISVFHGSPRNILNEYIYPNSPIEFIGSIDTPFVILGHTHYPMVRNIDNVIVINPGSVGQPRDYNKASYSILNTNSQIIHNFRVEYPIQKLINDIKRIESNNNYLIKVLKR